MPAWRSQHGRLRIPCLLFVCAAILAGELRVAGQCGKAPVKNLLDLNTATAEELEKLPEIGPTTAQAIVRLREKSGPFRRVEDLLAVRGITKRRLEKIRPLVKVEAPGKGEQPKTHPAQTEGWGTQERAQRGAEKN